MAATLSLSEGGIISGQRFWGGSTPLVSFWLIRCSASANCSLVSFPMSPMSQSSLWNTDYHITQQKDPFTLPAMGIILTKTTGRFHRPTLSLVLLNGKKCKVVFSPRIGLLCIQKAALYDQCPCFISTFKCREPGTPCYLRDCSLNHTRCVLVWQRASQSLRRYL